MTKRLVVAFAFLFTAFAVSLFAVRHIEGDIEAVLTEIENTEDVFLCAEKILGLREKNEKSFSLFLKHTDADMIDRLHLQLEDALERRDEETVTRLLAEIYAFLYVTAQGEKAKTENIF